MSKKTNYNHSNKFFSKKWKELKAWAKKQMVKLPYANKWQFEQDYYTTKEEGSKNVMGDIKYGLQYNTNYKTAKAEYNFLKEAGIKADMKLKQLKLMTTAEFYEQYANEIENFRTDMRTLGYNTTVQNHLVAIHFFGSD